MSLIRPGHKMSYVKGLSQGYVFLGSAENGALLMTDWGCNNTDLVEIIAHFVHKYTGEKEEDYFHPLETKWLLEKLSRRLRVSLEEKPLSWKDADKLEESWHNKKHWRNYIKESAKDDWEVYSESKQMWEFRSEKLNNLINDWMVSHYGTFEKYLEHEFTQRNNARKFVEDHWNDWETIEVPISIYASLDEEKKNQEEMLKRLKEK